VTGAVPDALDEAQQEQLAADDASREERSILDWSEVLALESGAGLRVLGEMLDACGHGGQIPVHDVYGPTAELIGRHNVGVGLSETIEAIDPALPARARAEFRRLPPIPSGTDHVSQAETADTEGDGPRDGG